MAIQLLIVPFIFFKGTRDSFSCFYFNYPKFSDIQIWANSVDPDQTASLVAVWSWSSLSVIPSTSFGHIHVWQNQFIPIFIPRHTILAGYYGFTLVVRVSIRLSVHQSYVRPSVFRFRMITWLHINGFSRNLICALTLWRSVLGLLMGTFRQIFTELSARDTPIFSFPDDNEQITRDFHQTCYMHWH